jgi:hypothetical protein
MTDANSGIVDFKILGVEEDPARFTIVLENKLNESREEVTDSRGRLSLELTPGIYVAYIKPANLESKRRIHDVPFLVEAGGKATIELDPSSEYVYCTADNDRVIPVRTNEAKNKSMKGLHRLGYESFTVKLSDKESLKIVVEYCGRKVQPNRVIQYQSAKVGYNDIRIFADNILFDSSRQSLEGWGRADVLTREKPPINPNRVVANFSHGKPVIASAGESIPSIKTEGSIVSGAAIFSFKINGYGVANFEYEDRKSGLKLVSRKHDPLFITSASKEAFTFSGSAELLRTRVRNANRRDGIVNFTMSKDADSFSLSIPTLKYQGSGPIALGDIKIGELSKSADPPLAGVYRRANLRQR